MSLEKFIKEFAELFPDLSLEGLDPETELKSLAQWDSLGVLLVISYADANFDRQLKGAELQACGTLEDLYNKVVG